MTNKLYSVCHILQIYKNVIILTKDQIVRSKHNKSLIYNALCFTFLRYLKIKILEVLGHPENNV